MAFIFASMERASFNNLNLYLTLEGNLPNEGEGLAKRIRDIKLYLQYWNPKFLHF